MIDCESGETAATCELVGACLDKAARKAIAWPKEVHKKATALITQPEPLCRTAAHITASHPAMTVAPPIGIKMPSMDSPKKYLK